MRFDEDARREYLEAIVFYSNRAEKIGAKFVDAVESAIAKIRSGPSRFRELEEAFGGVECHDFPYSMLYNVGQDEILILAIKHDRRNPDYWRYRQDR